MESSNSYLSYNNNNTTSNNNYAEEEEEEKRSSSSNKTFYSSLHAVRKPLIMKKPIAPFPPTKPRVYKVHPTKFKEVVQRLTAASPDQSHPPPRRLDDIAPPPLNLDLMISAITTKAARSATNCKVKVSLQKSSDQNSLDWSTDLTKNNNSMAMMGSNDDPNEKGVATMISLERNKSHHKCSECCGALSPLEFNFSPSGMTWPFSPLLSPGTLSSLDHTTVL